MTKVWSEQMGEISGFGGGYEATCRAMVLAGIQWCDEHPDADPQAHSFQGIYGIAVEDNDDCRSLVQAMMDAPVYLDGELIQGRAGDDCTGAMHQAALSHVFAYRRLGWDEYVRQLQEREP